MPSFRIIFYLLTPFFGKIGQKGQEGATDENSSVVGRLNREKSGQQDSPMVK
jgi:hypothetical protein